MHVCLCIEYVFVYSSMYFYSKFDTLFTHIFCESEVSASYSPFVPSDCFLLCVSFVIYYFRLLLQSLNKINK